MLILASSELIGGEMFQTRHAERLLGGVEVLSCFVSSLRMLLLRLDCSCSSEPVHVIVPADAL